ncbi:MAG TPA: hypothetical protein DDW50_19410 [Firmicutes bacterium]|nr:hypothetical protein [Bacillota bacterium]
MASNFRQWFGANPAPRTAIRNWVLPYWYQKQIDPRSPVYTFGGNDFRNGCFRNWTTIRLGNYKALLNIDRFGVIYIPELRISLELWVYSADNLYTPANFSCISQAGDPEDGILTVSHYDTGRCVLSISPEHDSPKRISCKIGLIGRPEDALKQSAVYFAIRPYDYNGFSAIYHLEYRDHFLWVNHTKILFLESELKHCFFTDGLYGDVTEYLRTAAGNTKMVTPEGMGTGLIGYSGLPAELLEMKMYFPVAKKMIFTQRYPLKIQKSLDVSDSLNQIESKPTLDQLLASNLKYLKDLDCQFNIYQLMALNRFSDGSQSRFYLKECLKKIVWDGSLRVRCLSPEQLIWGIGDYYQLMRDQELVEKNWSLIKRMGYAVWHQKVKPLLCMSNQRDIFTNQDGFYEKLFWLSGALTTLEQLAQIVGDSQENLNYKEQNRILNARLFRYLTHWAGSAGARAVPLRRQGGYGAAVIDNLAASYPLQYWKPGNSYIHESLQFIFAHYFYEGGIFSPFDFQGIDLARSARFGQVLIREGYDCTKVLKLLLAAAGDIGSLPDRIHPLTLKGIGENGHDPEVIYQVLLLIRNIFVLEEDQILELLPGLWMSQFWEQPQIRLNHLNTYFGEISCKCQRIGDQIQIDFWPHYRFKPEKVRLRFHPSFTPVFVDAGFRLEGSVLEIDPDFHKLRLKKRISVGLS